MAYMTAEECAAEAMAVAGEALSGYCDINGVLDARGVAEVVIDTFLGHMHEHYVGDMYLEQSLGYLLSSVSGDGSR